MKTSHPSARITQITETSVTLDLHGDTASTLGLHLAAGDPVLIQIRDRSMAPNSAPRSAFRTDVRAYDPSTGVVQLTDHLPELATLNLDTSSLRLVRLGHQPSRSAPVRVVALKGDDKAQMLDEVLARTGFLQDLDRRWRESGKGKDQFLIAVKPNLMMMTERQVPPVNYTDPELVEQLIDRIHAEGFQRIRLVEAQNLYGNWYLNRTVHNVARVAGYNPSAHGYQVRDLTVEQQPHDYGGHIGEHFVGRNWRDADYRISFAKYKTHTSALFTLTLKNIYGCLPMQDKALEYHAQREWDACTIDILRNFPVHFGFIDATWSADGVLGFKGTPLPKHTRMMYGGSNLIAVDLVAGRHMGVIPQDSCLVAKAIEAFGLPDIEYVGDVPEDYRQAEWDNVLPGLPTQVPEIVTQGVVYNVLEMEIPEIAQRIMDLSEESYAGFNVMGLLTNKISGSDKMDPAFPMMSVAELTAHTLEGMRLNFINMVKGQGEL